MTEVIETLLVIGDPTTTDEDLVVRLLASLPESYEMIVTVLSKFKCACLEMVIERLLHEERKMKEDNGEPGKVLAAIE